MLAILHRFLYNFSSTPSQAGIKGALAGTIWLMISIIPISIVLVGIAIYLEEYAKTISLVSLKLVFLT